MAKQTAPTPQNSGSDKKTQLKNAAYIVLIILLLGLAAGGVYAKYVYSNAATGTVLAREFYFSSDYLSADGAAYTLNPGTTEVTFELRNHGDSLRYSSDDIVYKISVTGTDATETTPTSVSLSVGGKNIQSGETQEDSPLKKDEKSSITITMSDLLDGHTYTVTATGTGGYKVGDDYKNDGKGGYSETLTATFSVLSAGTGVYMHLDTTNSAYVVLTVWTENVTGDATIMFPDDLIPDSTDPILATIQNYNIETGMYTGTSFSDNTSFDNPYSSRTYRFFKTSDYTGSDFTVTLTPAGTTTSITAEDAIP